MNIQEINSSKGGLYWENPRVEVKTTVDLERLDRRSEEQNTIQKIEWVYWRGERQALITLADGKTLFFDEFSSHVTNRWEVGDRIEIYKEGDYYYASGGRLATYSLSEDYEIREW